MGKFSKGVFLGSLLGAGAMWLNTTQRGKKLRSKFLDHAENVYKEVKEKIQENETYQELSEKKFKQIIEDVAEKYADKEELSSMTKKVIVRLINNHMDSMKAELKEVEQDQEQTNEQDDPSIKW